MSARPRSTKLTTIRAGIGTHRLSAGVLAGSPVGKLTGDQLEDVHAFLEHERERLAGLDDDAAVAKLKADLKAVTAERERRAVNLEVA
ncbi:MAG: hypothetical protein Q8K32_31235 [Archangium sp.]|nr:hypothetical protein [Archangium sp.]